MTTALILLFVVLFVVLAFEYINGFHDSANAIATVVSTKVLTPRQALLLASGTANEEAFGQAFNVGLGKATDLNELFQTIRTLVSEETNRDVADVIHRDFRAGDIRHSCADTTAVETTLGFAAEHSVMEGLRETVAWFLKR